MRQYLLLLLCGVLLVGSGCENHSANNSATTPDAEYQRQLTEAARQGEITTKQQAEMQRQLEESAKQADRMQKLIERWEAQADRQDKILDRQERQLPQPKDAP